MQVVRRKNMNLKMNNAGFSLVEVIVASVIFSIAVVGIYASLSSVKEQSQNISEVALGAALCAQQFLESKRAAVDMRDWGSGGQLAVTGSAQNAADCTQTTGATATTYHLTYLITDAGNARKATVTVTW